MFKFLFKKEQKVQELISKYLDNLKSTQEHFEMAMDCYFEFGLGENCDFLIKQTHKFESRADDIRNEIIEMMYSKVLIPESRGDIFRLLESIDLILTHFETVLFMIQGQRLKIPDFITPDLRELIEVSLECCDLVIRQVEAYFKKTEDIKALVVQMGEISDQADRVSRSVYIINIKRRV